MLWGYFPWALTIVYISSNIYVKYISFIHIVWKTWHLKSLRNFEKAYEVLRVTAETTAKSAVSGFHRQTRKFDLIFNS